MERSYLGLKYESLALLDFHSFHTFAIANADFALAVGSDVCGSEFAVFPSDVYGVATTCAEPLDATVLPSIGQ